jgi:hypothetical protein
LEIMLNLRRGSQGAIAKAPYGLTAGCFFFARARRIAWLNSPP